MADDIDTEQLGARGDSCPSCGYPLAFDQRYCLECGYRRAPSRVPYAQLLTGHEPGDVLSRPAPEPEPEETSRLSSLRTPLIAAGAAGAAAVVLALGVIAGLLVADGDEPQQVAAAPQQKPPIVNITNTGGGTVPVAEEELVEDWPSGESGWTVQLELLPKDSSDVAAVDQAKADAEAAGATEVGALDSDGYSSLDPGNYVVYSGVYSGKNGKAQARKALKKLGKDFPDAKVVKVESADATFAVADDLPEEKVEVVDDSTLEDLESSTGVEQQKKSAQLPETLALPGEPPKADKVKPGGGSQGDVIE